MIDEEEQDHQQKQIKMGGRRSRGDDDHFYYCCNDVKTRPSRGIEEHVISFQNGYGSKWCKNEEMEVEVEENYQEDAFDVFYLTTKSLSKEQDYEEEEEEEVSSTSTYFSRKKKLHRSLGGAGCIILAFGLGPIISASTYIGKKIKKLKRRKKEIVHFTAIDRELL